MRKKTIVHHNLAEMVLNVYQLGIPINAHVLQVLQDQRAKMIRMSADINHVFMVNVTIPMGVIRK